MSIVAHFVGHNDQQLAFVRLTEHRVEYHNAFGRQDASNLRVRQVRGAALILHENGCPRDACSRRQRVDLALERLVR